MISPAAVRSRRRDGEAGLTLVELMVVLVIAGIVLSGLTTFFVGTLRAAQRVDVRTTDHSNAQLAMVVLSRDVRAAVAPRPSEQPAFLSATPYQARFTSNIGSIVRPALIDMSIDADSRLLETSVEPTGSVVNDDLDWDADDAETRYVASFVLNEQEARPMFRYFAVDLGDPDDEDDTGDPLALTELVPDLDAHPGTGLSVQDRCSIAVVELTLVVGSDPSGRTGSFELVNEIRLPNSPPPTCPTED